LPNIYAAEQNKHEKQKEEKNKLECVEEREDRRTRMYEKGEVQEEGRKQKTGIERW
jgi:hypothetical protein